jgi:uncharacterized protein (DUF488 family)
VALIFTIGHSTRSSEEFIAMLNAHGIEQLVDVRTVPGSRRNPQFNQENLPGALRSAGIAYEHAPTLGGLRRPRKDSQNTGWRNESFRGYADYMQSREFAAAIEKLIETGANAKTTVMCAEAVPWRCHRSLIADALTARGVEVRHVMTREKADLHKMTEFAVVEGTNLWYPEGGQLRLL